LRRGIDLGMLADGSRRSAGMLRRREGRRDKGEGADEALAVVTGTARIANRWH
jgi:hypothetical protein